MTAKKKRGSSHMWQAILKGRVVLQKGLIKRVGDGNSINKWDDHWIPSNPGFKPIYPKARAEKVHEFLSLDRMSWNIRALRDNFLIHDENVVSRIPLGRLEEDTWAWSAEKHGMYTVRSAYRLLISSSRTVVLLKNNIACSSVSENNPIWQNLWKLKISPKLKVFWWRVINNFIHVHANLAKRHI